MSRHRETSFFLFLFFSFSPPFVISSFIHLVLPRVSIFLLLLLLDQLYLLVRSIAPPTPLRIPLQPSHAIASIFLPRFRNVCEPINPAKMWAEKEGHENSIGTRSDRNRGASNFERILILIRRDSLARNSEKIKLIIFKLRFRTFWIVEFLELAKETSCQFLIVLISWLRVCPDINLSPFRMSSIVISFDFVIEA